MDALNTRGWRDDVQVVEAFVWREWNDHPATVITARGLTSELAVAA
jgi:hypothetical protein